MHFATRDGKFDQHAAFEALEKDAQFQARSLTSTELNLEDNEKQIIREFAQQREERGKGHFLDVNILSGNSSHGLETNECNSNEHESKQ